RLCRAHAGPSHFDFIHVAPAPVLARLEGLHDGVLRGVGVPGGVLVGRRIAAAHVTTREAEPQVNPATAAAQAFLASLRCAGLYIANLIEVCTDGSHVPSGMKWVTAGPHASCPPPGRTDRGSPWGSPISCPMGCPCPFCRAPGHR